MPSLTPVDLPPLSGNHTDAVSGASALLVYDELPALICIHGADGRPTFFNRAWLRFTGCSLADALADGWMACVHPDDAERPTAALREARESRAAFVSEYGLRRADGEYRWMLEHAAPRYDARGEFDGYVGVALDITERKREEQKLRRLSKAVEQNPATVVITDLKGTIEYVNPKFTALTGYTFEEAIGQNPRILKSGETAAEEYKKLWETIQTGEWHGEFHNRKKNGELYWESASISPIRDARGKATHYIAIKEDITERKRMEEALRTSEERLRAAVQNAQLYVYDIDVRTGAGTNLGPDVFLESLQCQQDWARAIHPDDRERAWAAQRNRVEGAEAVQIEYRLVDPDGNVRHFLDYGAPASNGRLIGALRDITKAKQAEEAQARLAAVVEGSIDGILSLDSRGIVMSWNAAAERLYGYCAAEIVGRPSSHLVPAWRRADAVGSVRAVLAGAHLPAYEAVHQRKDGTEFPVYISVSPIRNQDGAIVGISSIFRDITGQKRAQAALTESENRFRALVQNSNDVVTLTDPGGVILYDSPGILDLLGISPEQRQGREVWQWVHPEELPYVRSRRQDLLRGGAGTRVRVQMRLRHRDGSWRWTDCWATNLLEEPGVRAVVISSRDISHLKGVETDLRDSEERYRGLVEDASDIVFSTDLEGHFTSVNGMGERISGYGREELVGAPLLKYAAAESHEAILRTVAALMAGETPPPLEAEMIACGGRRVAMEVTGRLQLRDGSPTGILGIARDISQRKRVEKLEHDRRQVLEMVAQNQPIENVLRCVQEMIEDYYPGAVACIVVDGAADAPPSAKGRASRAATQASDSSEESGGQRPDARELLQSGCQKCGAAPAGHHGQLTVPILSADGQAFGTLEIQHLKPWQPSESEQVLLDSMAKLAAIALEHRQLTQRLKYQAHHDPLTGLPNRTLLDDRLSQAIALARRQSRMVAVLYVDLDHFKYVNDTLGHDVGDVLLQEAGKRLAGVVRGSDTLARTGGDEFVAVLCDIQALADAEIVGARILEVMRAPFQVMGHELFVSASVGLSLFPQDGAEAATLQKHADAAMYEAKNRGRNRSQRFARAMKSASSERLEIENQLHRALRHSEFQLHYQPQFQLPSRRLCGVEALLRWNHPTWGAVPPSRFVPVAEESGLIVPIGAWVLQEAGRQHQAWRRGGHPPVKIAVNTSVMQFSRSNLAELAAEILAAHEMEPRYLELEITEGVLMRDAADSARQIAALRDLGVRLSIDDFGTGYSSLSYLQHLAIDDLKIDQCFVRGVGQAAGSQSLVQAVLGLAHALHLTATAEGVETEAELSFLEGIGCDQAQGFLLGAPAPADHWEALWRSGRT